VLYTVLHSQVLKLASVECPEWLRTMGTRVSETVNVLANAMHTALKRWIATEMR